MASLTSCKWKFIEFCTEGNPCSSGNTFLLLAKTSIVCKVLKVFVSTFTEGICVIFLMLNRWYRLIMSLARVMCDKEGYWLFMLLMTCRAAASPNVTNTVALTSCNNTTENKCTKKVKKEVIERKGVIPQQLNRSIESIYLSIYLYKQSKPL